MDKNIVLKDYHQGDHEGDEGGQALHWIPFVNTATAVNDDDGDDRKWWMNGGKLFNNVIRISSKRLCESTWASVCPFPCLALSPQPTGDFLISWCCYFYDHFYQPYWPFIISTTFCNSVGHLQVDCSQILPSNLHFLSHQLFFHCLQGQDQLHLWAENWLLEQDCRPSSPGLSWSPSQGDLSYNSDLEPAWASIYNCKRI